MAVEINPQQREVFLSDRPLLRFLLDPRLRPGQEDRIRAEDTLFGEYWRVRAQIDERWLTPVTETALSMLRDPLFLKYGSQHILKDVPDLTLRGIAQTFYMIGWQGGRQSSLFTDEIVAQVAEVYGLDQSVPLHERQLEDLGYSIGALILSGAEVKTKYRTKEELPADIDHFLHGLERRFAAREPDSDEGNNA